MPCNTITARAISLAKYKSVLFCNVDIGSRLYQEKTQEFLIIKPGNGKGEMETDTKSRKLPKPKCRFGNPNKNKLSTQKLKTDFLAQLMSTIMANQLTNLLIVLSVSLERNLMSMRQGTIPAIKLVHFQLKCFAPATLLLLLLLFTRPLPRDGGVAEDHGAPGAG